MNSRLDPQTEGKVPPPPGAPAEPMGEQPSELTAEEQMALYEEDLKQNDWGHQPC